MTGAVLCLRLFGPQASWGTEERGDTYRPSRRHPTRSAIVGLASAALGYGQQDTQAITLLSRGMSVAICSHGLRRVVTEFRTAQPGCDAQITSGMTRKQALSRKPGNASISYRESIEEGLWRVFIAEKGDEGVPLVTLAEAFKRPAFELCLGRREFPMALPTDPIIIQGGLEDALYAYSVVPSVNFHPTLSTLTRMVGKPSTWEVFSDVGFPGISCLPERVIKRPDDPFNTAVRTFRERDEERRIYSSNPTAPDETLTLVDEFFQE